MTVNGYTYKVGDFPNASGSVRVLLEMPTKETRWTTVSNSALV